MDQLRGSAPGKDCLVWLERMETWQELACKKRMAADPRNGELSTVKMRLKKKEEEGPKRNRSQFTEALQRLYL